MQFTSRFNSDSMTFECKESCWHMKLLHDCEATKDAMLLCKKDETFISMHRVVAAHGSPHLRQLFHKLKPGIVNGSVDVYSGVNMIEVNGGLEAGKVVVAVMYNGLEVVPMNWFESYVRDNAETDKREVIEKWVAHVREVSTIAKELGMHNLVQLALISMFNVMLHDKENSSLLMKGLVSFDEGEKVDELAVLAKHTYWFLKSANEGDAISLCSTHVRSKINGKDLDELDDHDFFPVPEIDHRMTPSVLLLGSSVEELNGVCEMAWDDSDIVRGHCQHLKAEGTKKLFLFTEKHIRNPFDVEKSEYRFKLESLSTSKRKLMESNEENVGKNMEAVGVWKNSHLNPVWEHNSKGDALPVPFRFCLIANEENKRNKA